MAMPGRTIRRRHGVILLEVIIAVDRGTARSRQVAVVEILEKPSSDPMAGHFLSLSIYICTYNT